MNAVLKQIITWAVPWAFNKTADHIEVELCDDDLTPVDNPKKRLTVPPDQRETSSWRTQRAKRRAELLKQRGK